MRLIDADALFEVLKGEEEYLDGEGLESRADGIRDAIMDVISAPTIESDWEEMLVICDNCGHAIRVKKIERREE